MSSPNLRHVDKLHERVKNYFGGKLPNSPQNYENMNFARIKNLIMSSRYRIIILFICLFFISLFILRKTKLRLIMEKRKTFDKPDKISLWKLSLWTIIISFLLTIMAICICYHFPKSRKILFIGYE